MAESAWIEWWEGLPDDPLRLPLLASGASTALDILLAMRGTTPWLQADCSVE